jgi:hypothetical protein
MTPKSGKIFQLATYLYTFEECMSCIYKNGVLKVEIAKGNNRKTVTLKPCLVKKKLDEATLPVDGRADYYLLCAESGDYILSKKYVMNQKITDKNKLVPLGTGNSNTFYDDIKKRLRESPLGAFATVKKWKT